LDSFADPGDLVVTDTIFGFLVVVVGGQMVVVATVVAATAFGFPYGSNAWDWFILPAPSRATPRSPLKHLTSPGRLQDWIFGSKYRPLEHSLRMALPR